MSTGTFQLIARHLVLALQPLREAVTDLESFQLFLLRMGWEVESLPPEWQRLGALAGEALAQLESVGEDMDLAQAASLIERARALHQAVQDLSTTPAGVDPQEFLAEVQERLLELLVVDYLADALPALYNALLALDVIQAESEPETDQRPAYRRLRLKLDEISRILDDPLSIPARVYGWGTPELDFLLIAGHLQELFQSIGVNSFLQQTPRNENPFAPGPANEEEAFFETILGESLRTWSLLIPFMVVEFGGSPAELGLALLELPAQGGKLPGLILRPLVPPQIGTEFKLDDSLTLRPRPGSDLASLFGIEIRPDDLNLRYPFSPGQELPPGGYGVELVYKPGTVGEQRDTSGSQIPNSPAAPSLLLGDPTGSRIQFGGLAHRLLIDRRDGGFELRLEISFEELALFLSKGDPDGFLGSLFGGRDASFPIPLAVQWSSRTGIGFSGAKGFQVSSHPHLQLGPVALEQLDLGLRPEEGNKALGVEATVSLAGSLGPFAFIVEGVGLRLELPLQKGAAGLFDLGVGFRPPSGLALVIDTETVTGGGYLFFDPEQGQYAGAIQLEFNQITFQATGLLTTRLPGGESGFSLLILVSAEGFTPVNLGFGFLLTNVGGLLGVNRTAAVEVLRAGLKNKALDAILFPENPVRDALRIINSLRAVFPPVRNQFVFGPMARIEWGVPALLTIDLGLILEFPSPTRLIALGQFRAFLPSQEKALVRLQMDALGVVDFGQGTAEVDATLYDSRLLQFSLTGDMALRARWSHDPSFVLAVGGLHPRFQPPSGFPQLKRLAVSLTDSDNPRLRLEGYLALTSNTVQFGARLDLFVSALGFSIEGKLGFDALFQFSPFQFVADFTAGVKLKWHGHTLLGVQLDMTLSGPTPWHARGKATFEIWIFSKSVSFDKKFGEEEQAPPLPAVDPLPDLVQALEDPRSWSGQLPEGGITMVSFRKTTLGPEVLIHPVGEIVVRQRVVPLNLEISRFGNTAPSGDRLFTLRLLSADSPAQEEVRPVKDHFAMAQFIELNDSQKISRPSFELQDAGLRIRSQQVAYGGKQDAKLAPTLNMDFETCIVGPDGECVRKVEGFDVAPEVFTAVFEASAAALAPLQHTGRSKYRAPVQPARVEETAYAIASTRDLTPAVGVSLEGATYTAAAQALQRHLEAHPEDRERLQVVARHELAEVTP